MSELEPRKRPKKQTARRHIPQVIVPVPSDQARIFVRDALTGTSIVNPIANYMTGWAFFAPYLRFTAVDDTHTLIELDVVQKVQGADLFLFAQRQGEIHRFFIAIEDEVDCRHRWDTAPPAGESIESATD